MCIRTKVAFPITWLCCALAIVARRPGMIFNPQPWAEDGGTFIQQQIRHGWHALFVPYAGYFHLVPRVMTTAAVDLSVAMGLGLVAAPFLMNLAAILIAAWAVASIVRPRFGWLAPTGWRLAAAAGVILLPASAEVFGDITNIQWWLGVYQFLLAWDMFVNRRAPGWADVAGLTVAGLCGPLGAVPATAGVLLVVLWQRDRQALARVAPFVLATCVEGWSSVLLRLGGAGQARFTLGFVLSHGLRAAFVGVALQSVTAGSGAIVGRLGFPGAMLLGVIVFAVVLASLRDRPRLAWAALGSLAFVLALESIGAPGWLATYHQGFVSIGGRYLFVPMAMLAVLAVAGASRVRPFHWRGGLACALLGLMLLADAAAFRIPAFHDYRWPQAVAAFKMDGTKTCRVPINPPGWSLRIPC